MTLSSWLAIAFRVSILGPLLFNISWAEDIDIDIFTDDNNPSVTDTNFLMGLLEATSDSLFQWLTNNQFKIYLDKCPIRVKTSQKDQ